jgi:predicted aldo/keto reductase-like oxidoreductase
MLTRLNIKNNDEQSILGFGCMRLPTKNGGIDEPRAIYPLAFPVTMISTLWQTNQLGFDICRF